jgi:F-type H+-transporting ATPase subunit c
MLHTVLAPALVTAASSGKGITGSIGAIGYGLAAIGPGIGVGLVFAAYINSSARQPESAAPNRQNLFLGFALIEALALIGIVIPFVFGK